MHEVVLVDDFILVCIDENGFRRWNPGFGTYVKLFLVLVAVAKELTL
jgi:hypothetical protein